MAATAATLSFSLNLYSDPQTHQKFSPAISNYPFLTSKKPHRPHLKSFSSHSSPPATEQTTGPSSNYSNLEDSFKPGRFLTNEELEQVRKLENFTYFQELKTGSLLIRVMRPDEMDVTVKLLAESFAESMLLPYGYVSLLRFLVKQYLIERGSVMPHAVTLIGFYRDGDGEDGEEMVLAGTVEVCFDKRGANASPPTPTPPKNSPYICNMTVKESLRRRGLGWNLLKASEELISQMSCEREVYLHCRMIDSAPFNMYIKAGYNVVNTDSIFVLLMLQRRKHLMCKKLPVLDNSSEVALSDSDMEVSS
ncbi:uncharacterized protein LOC126686461 [Mercurialis annua]|uniref:uncharacterized protein LOC126686461 n=1 Tax=Mercurialis annua TaxID=3986 RepID=UPI00215E9A06|nr:uncharacterized protein LOC126686461 [Mercurialis annua]